MDRELAPAAEHRVCWYEHCRNILHWLLLPNCFRRDLAALAAAPDDWPQASSGSIQKLEWLALGFNLQTHVEKVFGTKLKRPITKFHGSQVHQLFTEQSRLWDAPPLKAALEVLKEDGQIGSMIEDLLTTWDALSRIHSCVNTHPTNLPML